MIKDRSRPRWTAWQPSRPSKATLAFLLCVITFSLLTLFYLFDLSFLVTLVKGPPTLPPLRLLSDETLDGLAKAKLPNVTQSVLELSDGLEPVLGDGRQMYAEGFSIVTPTYRRLDMLPRFLDTYAGGKIPSLRHITIQWVDSQSSPPAWLEERMKAAKVPCRLRVMNATSLNERFRPDESIGTSAVLSLDDDVLLRPVDVEQGYQAWRQFGQGRRRMVGFFARTITDDLRYSARRTSTYNMVLTKAAFFHVDWLDAYWITSMGKLRSVVEDSRNCEDILMSFLIAYYTRQPPIYVRAPYSDYGTWKGGISQGRTHAALRDRCASVFTDAFGRDTLPPSSLEIKIR